VQLWHKLVFSRVKAVFFASLLSLGVGQVWADSAVIVASVSGYVTVTDSEGETKRLKDGDKVEAGSVINTGSGSGVIITLPDGKVVNLGELDSFAVTPGAGDGSGGAFAQGSFSSKPGSPTLSTATSAGGGVNNGAPTTPQPGGSPTN